MTGAWLASYLVLWALVIALAVTTLMLGRALRRRTAASDAALSTDGAPRSPVQQGPRRGARLWAVLREPGELAATDRAVLMIFVSRTCAHCREVTAKLGELRAIPRVTLAVRTRDPIELGVDPHLAMMQLHDVPYAHDAAAFGALDIHAVPYVVLASADGAVLASRAGADPAEVRAMVERALA